MRKVSPPQDVPSALRLGRVRVDLDCLPNFAWARWNLAEAARQLGKMEEHPFQFYKQMGHLVLIISSMVFHELTTMDGRKLVQCFGLVQENNA